MGNDLQKGTTYATGGVGGQGTITSTNLNAHVDDAIIKPTFISSRTERTTLAMTDEVVVQSGGSLYRTLLSTLYPSGSVLQTVVATPYTANANLGVIPLDDTIPQITEGTEILTLNISPSFTTSRISLRFNGFGGHSAQASLTAALFRTGIANALKSTTVAIYAPLAWAEMNIDWIDSPASTSAQTYSIRAGTPSGTARMNGHSSSRIFGGSAACTLVAQEIR